MRDWKRLLDEKLPDLSSDPAREASIREELAEHLEDRYQEALAKGLEDEAAYRFAADELDGSHEAILEFRRLDRPRLQPKPPPSGQKIAAGVAHDVRYAFRVLRTDLVFSSLAVLILAVSIGSATSIFSIVSGLLLQPLPYPEGERLVFVGHATEDGRAGNLGFLTWRDWNDRSEAFSASAPIRSWSPTLSTETGAERLSGLRVGQSYFSLLGVKPAEGRDFMPQEDNPTNRYSAIISHSLWGRKFGLDPNTLGRSILLDDRAFTIVGIMGAEFDDLIGAHSYHPPEIWAPLGYDATLSWACRGCQHLKAVAKLAPGREVESADAELDAVQAELNKAFSSNYGENEGAAVVLVGEEITRPVRPALAVLSVAVLFLLLIGCSNVAHMLLVRGIGRRKEMSLRSVLGAGRMRLGRQLLTESVLLGLLGGLLGLLLSMATLRVLLSLTPSGLAGLQEVSIDWRAMLFAAGVSLLTGVLFGLAPALNCWKADLMAPLRQEGRMTASRSASWGQRLLVGLNLTLALALVWVSLLMVQTMANLMDVDPGFEAAGLLTAKISLTGRQYEEDVRVTAALSGILEQVEAIPGLKASAAASQVPLAGNWDSWGFHRKDAMESNPAEAPSVQLYSVTPGYFSLLGIERLAGRLFEPEDRAGSVPVLILGESTAKQLYPGENPIGRQARIGASDEGPWWTVVGIVNDVHHADLSTPPGLQMYLPITQRPYPFVTLLARGEIPQLGFGESVRQAVTGAAPGVPVYDVIAMDAFVGRATADRRFVMVLLAVFAGAAILLTAAGVYALASFAVGQRAHELGLRLALGADRAAVIKLVLGSGLGLAGAAVAAGLMVILGLTSLMDRLLFGIHPFDTLTVVVSSSLIVIVLLLSHLRPLIEALRIDPARVLRSA